ncbi:MULTISPECIES: hypothetical protein [Polymorphospora]|uniref:Uncharacterized protein n=1 Tax=Polymorphospora lycopeni TaxID=3140240 RepID=A0ABV5CU83_9ACTN
MEFYVNQRSAGLSAALVSVPVVRLLPAADAALLPVTHPAPTQAELILAPKSVQGKGISGFAGGDVPNAPKRMDVRGVPPRGRPV